LSVYPNPVANELTIDVPAKGTLRIFNSLGQVIRQINQVNQGTETLTVSNLVTGTYFIEIATQTGIYRAQLVKK
ncbi:MAG: T9SS type A sorting domain-containing protein, partial [Flavobacteriales bacterium]